MMRYFAAPLLLLLPGLAAAQPAAPTASSVATPAADNSIAVGIDRFYAGRAGALLWIEGGQLSPAGRLVLARLRSADIDGMARGPALAAQVDAALAATTPDVAAADRLLSVGWTSLIETLQGPVAGATYVEPATRPRLDPADRMLTLAGQAPDLSAYATTTMRKSRFYEELRVAVIADAARRGGVADPRLVANLHRARTLPSGGRYVFVNPATAELMMVEDGEVRDRMRIVVGTAHTPTAPLASMIHFATVNPYWNVAEDLVAKIVAPRVVGMGLAYLKRANYEAVDRYGADARIIAPTDINWKAVAAGTESVKLRQRPGPYNSMGRIKFGFANAYGIFLHDTPNKPQFAKTNRATSNGCIRLEDAPRLARWLFGRDPVAATAAADEPIRLPSPVPIYIAYITANPADSMIVWARDVYGMDPAKSTNLAS